MPSANQSAEPEDDDQNWNLTPASDLNFEMSGTFDPLNNQFNFVKSIAQNGPEEIPKLELP